MICELDPHIRQSKREYRDLKHTSLQKCCRAITFYRCIIYHQRSFVKDNNGGTLKLMCQINNIKNHLVFVDLLSG